MIIDNYFMHVQITHIEPLGKLTEYFWIPIRLIADDFNATRCAPLNNARYLK